MKNLNIEEVESAVKNLLTALGEDVDNDPDNLGLKETPRRVAKYWAELLEGEDYTNKEIAEMFSKDFKVSQDAMVIKEVDDVYSHCAHHMALMYNGTFYIAYIPTYWNGTDDSEGYRVIGLSKIPRIVNMCAKRLQMQEKLCADVAECIQLATGSNKVYVRSVMDHGCVSARGSKSEGVTDVTYITPELRKDVAARKEIDSKVQSYIHKRS